MKASDLAKWLESAREAGADRIEVRRARSAGKVEEKLFCEETLETVNADTLNERMRDDAIGARRLASAQFEIRAYAGKSKEPVMAERITIKRADDELEFGEDPSAKLAAVAVREMQAMARVMTDAVKGSNVDIRDVLKETRELVSQMLTHQGEVLDAMFTMASLKEETAAAERISKEKQNMAKLAVEELAPIAGAILMKLGKKSGPGLVALFRSLKDEQLTQLQQVLSAEQMALLSSIVGELEGERQKAKKGE